MAKTIQRAHRVHAPTLASNLKTQMAQPNKPAGPVDMNNNAMAKLPGLRQKQGDKLLSRAIMPEIA